MSTSFGFKPHQTIQIFRSMVLGLDQRKFCSVTKFPIPFIADLEEGYCRYPRGSTRHKALLLAAEGVNHPFVAEYLMAVEALVFKDDL